MHVYVEGTGGRKVSGRLRSEKLLEGERSESSDQIAGGEEKKITQSSLRTLSALRGTDEEAHRLKPMLPEGLGLDDVVADGVEDEFGEGANVELEHDVGAVGFGGVDADVEE